MYFFNTIGIKIIITIINIMLSWTLYIIIIIIIKISTYKTRQQLWYRYAAVTQHSQQNYKGIDVAIKCWKREQFSADVLHKEVQPCIGNESVSVLSELNDISVSTYALWTRLYTLRSTTHCQPLRCAILNTSHSYDGGIPTSIDSNL